MANKDKVINLRINSEAYDKLKEYCKEDMGVSQFIRELVKKELVKKNIMLIKTSFEIKNRPTTCRYCYALCR